MMWLHRIQLNIEHPAARRDVADPYQMHKTLTRAFVDGPNERPHRFLWRLEDSANMYGLVLVQSESMGKFHHIDDEAHGYFISTETKEFVPGQSIRQDAVYHFRLRANPTVTRAGKRHALVGEDEQIEWLRRQGQHSGFHLIQCIRGGTLRLQMHKKGKDAQLITIGAATFDGVLRVTDVDAISTAIANGLGHAKSFGLGLLSLARGG